MAANRANVIQCTSDASPPISSEWKRYREVSVRDTKPNATDVRVELKVIDPVLLYERKQPLDYEEFSQLTVLESNENGSENIISNCGSNDTLPNNLCGEADLQLIVPDLLPERVQHTAGNIHSGLEPNENSDEIVDSKIGVFSDKLPNVCYGETEAQLIVPDLLPGNNQQVADKIHSGLEPEENICEEFDSKISAGICEELELRDIKPCKVGLDSLRIDPDALRGRMQQMVDKIRSGLTGLCTDPWTAPCFQSPGSSSSASNKHAFRSRKCIKHQVKHKRKRLYLCPYCQEVFINCFKREVHMMMHVGEKT